VCIPNRILPALLILPVEGKELHDKLVDLCQRQHLAPRMLDRHSDQRYQARHKKYLILLFLTPDFIQKNYLIFFIFKFSGRSIIKFFLS
jgi:hypothetical protein